MTKTFPEVISGIRTAKRGVEVREDIAQMGEYVEQFAATATEKAEAAAASEKKASDAVANIDQQTEDAVAAVNTAETKALQDVETARTGALTDIETARSGTVKDVTGIWDAAVQAVTDTRSAALEQLGNSRESALTALEEKRTSALQEMQASVDAAAGSAKKAATSEENAKESEDAAKASEEAAAKSEANSAASESAAQKSAEEAAASAELAGTRAGTDKTLSVENAPADAKQVGDELAVRYTKEQVDTLLTQYKADWLLAAYPVGSLYLSTNPTSPAELFGGTWEQIAADRALMGASSSHSAGSTAEAGLPNVSGEFAFGDSAGYLQVTTANGAFYGTFYHGTHKGLAKISGISANVSVGFSAARSSGIYGKSSTVQPPAYYVNIWRRIE